jgi:hypothetical protein
MFRTAILNRPPPLPQLQPHVIEVRIMSKRQRVLNSPLWRLAAEVHRLLTGSGWRRSLREMTGCDAFTLREVYDPPDMSVVRIESWENALKTELLKQRRIRRRDAYAAMYDRIEKIQKARATQAERPPVTPDPDWLDAEFQAQITVIERRPAR